MTYTKNNLTIIISNWIHNKSPLKHELLYQQIYFLAMVLSFYNIQKATQWLLLEYMLPVTWTSNQTSITRDISPVVNVISHQLQFNYIIKFIICKHIFVKKTKFLQIRNLV